MKTRIFFILGCAFITGIYSCKGDSQARYLDLNTGNYLDLKKDSTTGLMVNAETGKPADVYVDTETHDTIYGHTGEVVNGRVHKTEEGTWVVKTDGDEYKAKSGDAKIKMEGEEYKSKDGETTIKQEDGDVKIENGKTQTKIDGKTGEVKVKKDKNIADKIKKIIH
jgi:predicted PilT family ATPase